MKIIVLIKQVPDTWHERTLDLATGAIDRLGTVVIDEINERAIEVALAYQDVHDAEVVVLTMGPKSATEMLRGALAMGADSAIHVLDEALAGSDMARTARVLVAALKATGFDLVVAGNESTDGRGGVIPAMVAEGLGIAHATHLNSVVIGADSLSGERGTEGGTMSVRASLPAVISVTELAPAGRFATFRNTMKAKKKPILVWSAGDAGVDDRIGTGRSVVLATERSPAREAGVKVIDDGTAGEALVDFLAARRLI